MTTLFWFMLTYTAFCTFVLLPLLYKVGIQLGSNGPGVELPIIFGAVVAYVFGVMIAANVGSVWDPLTQSEMAILNLLYIGVFATLLIARVFTWAFQKSKGEQ